MPGLYLKRLGTKIICKFFTELFIIILLLFLVPACNAPRNNPLDPLNPNYSFVTLEGVAQTYSLPYTGISNVVVTWIPGNILVTTDNNGNFKIDNILPVNGKLIFQKDGYRADTIDVIWGSSKTLFYQVNLNVIPHLDSISIYTVVINQFTPPGQSFQLVINAQISDKDNDIDSVYVENAQLNLIKPLGFDIVNKVYETVLTTQDLNVNDIEQTIGFNFNIVVKDIFNRTYLVGSSQVSRVIKNGVSIEYPANDTTVTPTPVFVWQRYKSGFPFKYMIEVYTNDFANSQLVFRGDNISSDSVAYHLSNPLTTKSYYWVIWVIDQFQNRCRSLPATFKVP